ncbi:MAG: helix-turn-helix domain-containing protein [Candidatus Latescibacterota bacterium]
MTSARAMAQAGRIEADHLWPRVRQAGGAAASASTFAIDLGLSLKEARDLFDRAYLDARLKACGWRLDEAARSLGLSRSRLYELVRQFGLHAG